MSPLESTDTLTPTPDLDIRRRSTTNDLTETRFFLGRAMKYTDCPELRSVQAKIANAISCVDDAIEEIRS